MQDQFFTLVEGGVQGRTVPVPQLSGLDQTRSVILMFKVSGTAGAHLAIDNVLASGGTSTLIDFVLDGTFSMPRSWHEFVNGQDFSSVGANSLTVSLPTNPPAAGKKVTVSDFVIFYHTISP
jgi:hypothetical protein